MWRQIKLPYVGDDCDAADADAPAGYRLHSWKLDSGILTICWEPIEAKEKADGSILDQVVPMMSDTFKRWLSKHME